MQDSNSISFTKEAGAGAFTKAEAFIRINVVLKKYYLQLNFNGSNTFGTMKISSRQG